MRSTSSRFGPICISVPPSRLSKQRAFCRFWPSPNLVASEGKEAHFTVGGEFPVPVPQAGAAAGAITIQFREYGIRLTFLPTVTPNGTIRMHVTPEVSTIDLANGIVLNGFSIPALSTPQHGNRY